MAVTKHMIIHVEISHHRAYEGSGLTVVFCKKDKKQNSVHWLDCPIKIKTGYPIEISVPRWLLPGLIVQSVHFLEHSLFITKNQGLSFSSVVCIHINSY